MRSEYDFEILCFAQTKKQEKLKIPYCTLALYPEKTDGGDIPRFHFIASTLVNWIERDGRQKKTIYIEDYSFGSKGRVFNIAEATGIFKHMLFEKGHLIEKMSPGMIKKLATGRGNATKEDMFAEWTKDKKLPDIAKDFELNPDAKQIAAPVTDIIDSYWVARAALNCS